VCDTYIHTYIHTYIYIHTYMHTNIRHIGVVEAAFGKGARPALGALRGKALWAVVLVALVGAQRGGGLGTSAHGGGRVGGGSGCGLEGVEEWGDDVCCCGNV